MSTLLLYLDRLVIWISSLEIERQRLVVAMKLSIRNF